MLSCGLVAVVHARILACRPHPPTGQMQNEAACKTLEQVLENTSDDSMVRHEVKKTLHWFTAARAFR